MLIVILIIGGIFILAFMLAGGVVFTQNNAKKSAIRMLNSSNIDKAKAWKILKTLSTCTDNEGKRLYNKLSDAI